MAQSARGGQRAGPPSQALTPPALSRSRARGRADGLVIRAPWPVRSRNSGVEGCSVAEPSQPESRAQPSWSLSWFVVFECVLDAISRQQHTVVTNPPSLSGLVKHVFCKQPLGGKVYLTAAQKEGDSRVGNFSMYLAVSDDAPPAFIACWREKLTRHPALFTVFLNWFFHYCIINDFSRTRRLCPASMEGDIDRRHRAGHIHHLLAAFLCAGPLHPSHQRQPGPRYSLTRSQV